MKQSSTILVSNTPLPALKIGSWTTRIDRFNKEHQTFDIILSPNAQGNRYLFCKKRKFLTWQPSVRALMLRYWVAKEYLRQIAIVAKDNKQLTIVVMDDVHLLEAIAALKARLKVPIKLIFSFHGFELKLSKKLQEQVDKVLFLTHSCFEQSQKVSGGFLPEISVVGNAVDSTKFFLPTPEKKQELRVAHAIKPNETVFIWMANDRPIKGLEAYRIIAMHYAKQNPLYKFLVIGNSKEYDDSYCTYLGKIANDQLAEYLQMGDFYVFTAFTREGFGLSLVEAYKCGNFVLAPATGAIPEVFDGLPNHLLMADPKDIYAWIETIDTAVKLDSEKVTLEFINDIWSYEAWEQKFLNAIT